MTKQQNIFDVFEIEKIEKEILLKFGWLFKNSLDEFSTSIDRSLGYLDKIILPTIMASKQDKSYNPFSEIIEKYAIHILIHKLEKEGYKLLPLGYSADLTLESEEHILSIDIKTANLDNPSDFRKTINVGINQMTHIAKLRINRKFLSAPFFVYPTIPPYYETPDGRIKLVLTYGLLFIYPSYSDLVREIRQEYVELFEFFKKKVRNALIPILIRLLKINEKQAEQILNSKPERSRYTREELIVENIIRGIFIHEQERETLLENLDINSEDKKVIEMFSEKLREFTDKLRKRDIKPIAIIAIAIPNGLLKEKYLDKFVSGKNYSKSARYHYEDGIFEIIKEKTGDVLPRVLFLDINEDYLSDLKRYFDEIVILDYKLKEVVKMRDVILHGDVYACLEQLEDNSIAVAITSPPYWKQRDYGFEGQIGQENTPEEYIGRLVTVFNKLRQKLRNDGVFFLNVGDKYLHRYGKSHLLQIPYRLAYHMIKDGWYLEDIIIWYKPNHMPSSVKDRFTNTYEPVLVFSKGKNNIYKKGLGNVVKIPLRQTPWKHTAVFPEKLVEEMLSRTNLNDGDIILDPFAGTGTVAVVVKKIRSGLFPKRIYSIMIEKGEIFIDIIKKRTGIKDIEKVDDISYRWKPVKEEKLPNNIEPKEILTDKHGEVFIADTTEEFLSALKGITTEKFKTFHREDAIYFFGVKNGTICDLYYIHSIFYEGYVLRNMLVVSRGEKWHPIFMFAKDSTRVEYKFYLDRVRVKPKTKENRNWWDEDFIGIKVRDISGKKTKEGRIVKIIERYKDGFPKIVVVQWNGYVSVEFVLHPEKDEFIMEGLIFKCPKCKNRLEEPYDPVGENRCPTCGALLWTTIKNIPIIEEPEEICEVIKKLETVNYNVGEVIKIEEFEKRRKETQSKFVELERINWGASPGARKLMLGEYFTKMRLYRIDQPTIAQYLTILRKHRGLSIQNITNKLPRSYKYTVGHWFRKDFGGSVPIPEDVPLLKEIFGVNNNLLNVLERTALKFQTVKTSIKGKNPGDFIEGLSDIDLIRYLKKLYIPPQKYIKLERHNAN